MTLMDEMFAAVSHGGRSVKDWRKCPETEPADLDDMGKAIQTTSLSKLITDDAADQATGHIASRAQIEAGNYKKGHLNIGPLDISIENPAGSKRRPEWPPLKHHYGYIRGTVGADGDHVDCFVRTGISADYDNTVWVINQANAQGGFDEHKCMIGWPAEWEATAEYLSNYEQGWDRIISVVGVPFSTFCDWVRNGDHKSIYKGAQND